MHASYKLYFFWNLYYLNENDVSLLKKGIIDEKKILLCQQILVSVDKMTDHRNTRDEVLACDALGETRRQRYIHHFQCAHALNTHGKHANQT